MLDAFTKAYITAMLWSTNDESTPEGGVPLDQNYSINDISDEAMMCIIEDCRKFQEQNHSLLRRIYDSHNATPGRAGHDFWLNRNFHGAGYWDRGYGTVGDALSAASHVFGEVDPYVGDDKKIYLQIDGGVSIILFFMDVVFGLATGVWANSFAAGFAAFCAAFLAITLVSYIVEAIIQKKE